MTPFESPSLDTISGTYVECNTDISSSNNFRIKTIVTSKYHSLSRKLTYHHAHWLQTELGTAMLVGFVLLDSDWSRSSSKISWPIRAHEIVKNVGAKITNAARSRNARCTGPALLNRDNLRFSSHILTDTVTLFDPRMTQLLSIQQNSLR